MKTKSNDELLYIIADASEAAKCAKDLGNIQSECKYLDQIADASDELNRRTDRNSDLRKKLVRFGEIKTDFRHESKDDHFRVTVFLYLDKCYSVHMKNGEVLTITF